MARKRKTSKEPEQSSQADTSAQTQATWRRPSVPAPLPALTSTSAPTAPSVQPPVQAPLNRQHDAPPQHVGGGGQAQGQSRAQGPLQGQGQGRDEASSSAPTGRERGMKGVEQGTPVARSLGAWGRGAPYPGPLSPSFGPGGGPSVQVAAQPGGYGTGVAAVDFLFGSLTVQDLELRSDVDPPHEFADPSVPGYDARAMPPPISSKKETFPKRPDTGRAGEKCMVKANHFSANLPDKDLHQYDVAINPEVTSRGVNRAIIEQLVKLYRDSHLGTRLPAYDGRKSLFTAGPLPFQSREFQINLLNEDDGSNQPRRERPFKVVIRFAARANLHHLGEFLRGRQADAPKEALQVLDIVLRELPTIRYFPVGRCFYSPNLGTRQPLGGGLESWRGFYQSIRPTQMGLSLNIDMSSTAFIEPKPVSQFVGDLLNKDLTRTRLTDADCIKIKKTLRGVKVEVTHRGSIRRKYRISGLTSQATNELEFPVDENGPLTSITDYFRDTYGYIIRHPTLPCLQVGNPQRPNYLPMEVCKIIEGQRYSKRLNERQIEALRNVTCQPPRVRESDIHTTVAHNAYDKDPYAQEFGIRISNQLTRVPARILPAPRLKYHDTGREKDCLPRLGSWNMTNKKLVNGGIVSNWACINFSRNVADEVARYFCRELAKMCANSGMQFNQNPILCMRSDVRPEASEKALSNLYKDANTRTKGKGLDLLVVILPINNGSLYGDLKKQCEIVLGVVSQCCLDKHLRQLKTKYLANVALKINVKVGGRNTVLMDSLARKGFFVSKPTIIFGADVTHPHPGEDSSPSIAAVVASQDWPEATKYAGLVSAQTHRQEIIQDLYKEYDEKGNLMTDGMVRELLLSFYRANNKQKPERIIFYRDGVSEGQFYQVLQHELGAIKKACASLDTDYKPTITFVVVQKGITLAYLRATMTTFVLSTIHQKIFYQGTSRPAHYHVLWDENNLTADDLQLLTNSLCYTYARCTRSLSIVPPAQYAHLLAFRARFYMDAEASDTGSVTSARTHRVGGGNAVRALPDIHSNLKP